MINHKPVSLSNQIFEKLEKDILTGKYEKGLILTEHEISEELGVSRTPVREALIMLEQEHIVEPCGKGVKVLSITAEDAEIIYEIRSRIEGIAAAECAKRITDEQIKEIQEMIDLQFHYASKGNSEKEKSLDNDFHNAVYKYAGSAVFFDTLMPLHKKIQKFRKVQMENSGMAQQSVEEHQEVLDAIASRDPVKAEKAMTGHVENARERLKNIVGKFEEQ